MDKPPLSPYGAFIGISIDDFSEGKVTCSVALRDHHLNNGGRVHGGVLTSLADTAAGAAVRTVRPEGKLTATTDLSISFLRPPVGNQLVAVAEVLVWKTKEEIPELLENAYENIKTVVEAVLGK